MAVGKPENLVAGYPDGLGTVGDQHAVHTCRHRHQSIRRTVHDCRRRGSGHHRVVSLLCLETVRDGRCRALFVSYQAPLPCCSSLDRLRVSLAASLGLGVGRGLFRVRDRQ